MEFDDLVRMRRVRDLMDREYAEPLDVPRLAREAHMSPEHFQRSFKEAFGETPYSYPDDSPHRAGAAAVRPPERH